MNRIDAVLSRLEVQLRLLVEGDASEDGFPKMLHIQLERALMRAMKTGERRASNEADHSSRVSIVPDQYTLVLPANEAQILLTHPAELDRLTHRLENAASFSRLAFATPPMLHVVADPQATEIDVQSGFVQAGADASSTYQLEEATKLATLATGEKLPNAFLIVNGLATFPISAPIVNIGRASFNQLKLDDPHISLQHAQLRFVQGHFVIFDLDSRMGTFVNGVPVSSHALKPGDVIQLCGIPLVYGLETTRAGGQTQELPIEPPHPEVL